MRPTYPGGILSSLCLSEAGGTISSADRLCLALVGKMTLGRSDLHSQSMNLHSHTRKEIPPSATRFG